MKKVLSLVLAFLMVFVCVAPASAMWMQNWSPIPIINISGDGEPLYDIDGNQIFKTTDILNGFKSSNSDNSDDDSLMDSVVNVLYPFLVEGMLTNKWDNYYNNLYKEISEIFEKSLLTKDGEAPEGTGLSESRKQQMAGEVLVDYKAHYGSYLQWNYKFYYDWRLDPMEIADQFNDYIKQIKATTGAEKVSVSSKCLGTNVVLAYVAKYGLDDINGIGFDGGTVNGCDPLSETISGKLSLDGNAIKRMLIDCNVYDVATIDEFIIKTVELATKGGLFNTLSKFSKSRLYEKLEKGVTSALARASVFTWPSYWAGVTTNDYETAKNYVFGDENSNLRTEYKGLIEKLDNYDVNVRQRIPELLESAKNAGVKLCFIAKYGCQMVPVCDSATLVGDQLVSVKNASFGATTTTVYETFSDEYIAQREQEGKGINIFHPISKLMPQPVYTPNIHGLLRETGTLIGVHGKMIYYIPCLVLLHSLL